MAFEGLTEKLSAAFKKLRGTGRLTEADVKAAMREIRLALLEADVSYKVVKDFIGKVSARAVGSDVLESLTPAHQRGRGGRPLQKARPPRAGGGLRYLASCRHQAIAGGGRKAGHPRL